MRAAGPLWAIIILLAVFLPLSSESAQAPQVVHFMSREESGERKTDYFDCHDAIYFHAELARLNDRGHEARVIWTNPDGEMQDEAFYAFSGRSQRVWFWLRLRPSLGGKVLKSFDPSFGMDKFIGAWTVDLYLDGAHLVRRVFLVAC